MSEKEKLYTPTKGYTTFTSNPNNPDYQPLHPQPPPQPQPRPLHHFQPPVADPTNLPKRPATLRCPYCQVSVITNVKYRRGLATYALAAFTCVVCLPFFWVPLVVKSTRDVIHTCPRCGQYIGRHDACS
ncbi:hypothetical protein IWQ62_002562 [Dispira parvispora]|uniref:LITAF domain-containing protein n=1 Tax=Dispira parvispora TaxID=1520584 RepID=A0A9W8AQ42_9FUNG|nr:hypothetical protein IWQ62_002562 [Dispira parvispora]